MTTPAGARLADVQGGQELVSTALRDGFVELAAVTENDLCVLDAGSAVLVDAEVWTRWTAYTDEQRALLRQASIGTLCAAGLLRPRPGAYVPRPEDLQPGANPPPEPELSEYDVSPQLATALLARQRPVFVVTGSAPTAAADDPAPRCYGFADEASQSLTVVWEQRRTKSFGRFGHQVSFMLLTPDKAAEVLVRWLCVALRNTWEPAGRTVRVITNPTGGPRTRSWTATPVADGWSITTEPADQSSVDATTSDADPTGQVADPLGQVNDAASLQQLTDDLAAAMNGWDG